MVVSHGKLMFVSGGKWWSRIKDGPLPSPVVLWIVSVWKKTLTEKNGFMQEPLIIGCHTGVVFCQWLSVSLEINLTNLIKLTKPKQKSQVWLIIKLSSLGCDVQAWIYVNLMVLGTWYSLGIRYLFAVTSPSNSFKVSVLVWKSVD